ncbi:MAG TPA: hypothetical protein VN898_13175 [Candidatus Binatia bacterium]|nr:hypothetical protein [Candidatus Binatia bacterium]
MKARTPARYPGRLLALPLVLALMAGLVLSWTRRADASLRTAPLTNEDVVRMTMTGVPEREILAAIEARTVDFDLSTEMLGELRVAGVSDRVIEAMRRRQAAMPRSEPPPAPTPAPARMGSLRIEFDAGDEGDKPSERSAIALRKLPKGLERRGGVEVGEMSDMALAVLCTTADHVPDHWDTRSPLQGAPRHELLQMATGSATEKVKGHEILYLDRKDAYDLEIAAGNHNIVVAAAGKQAGSGTWRLLESDGARVTVLEGRRTRIVLKAHSRIKGSFMAGFSVDSEWRIVSVEVPEAAAAPEARP